jgi:hypothetical protein
VLTEAPSGVLGDTVAEAVELRCEEDRHARRRWLAHVFDATHDCDLGAGYADALYSVLRLLADAASGSGGSRARTSSVSPEVGADPETER